MPDSPLTEPLEWSPENLSQAIADLYRDAETDQDLHTRLMTDPHAVLSSRINLPEEYQGMVFAKPSNRRAIILHVPEYGQAASEPLPEGTTEAEAKPQYEVTCTITPPW